MCSYTCRLPQHAIRQTEEEVEILDICLTKNIVEKPELTVLQQLSSDTNSIQINIKNEWSSKEKRKKKQNTTEIIPKSILPGKIGNINPIYNIEEIDKAVEEITREIKRAIEEAPIPLLPELRQKIK